MKKIMALFLTNHHDTVGNAYRINRIVSLSKKYQLSLITNAPVLFADIKNKCKIIEINKSISTDRFNYRNSFLIANIINNISDIELLYFFHNDANVALFIRHKKMLCEIHQSHELIGIGNSRGTSLKTFISYILLKISAYLLIQGLKKADYSFAVSSHLVKFFISKGINREKIEYLPHGVDTLIFKMDIEKKRHPQKLNLIYTGWIDLKRGLNLMLDGIQQLTKLKKEVYLTLVGCEDEQLIALKEDCKSRGISSKVSLIKRLDYKEIPNILISADIALSFLDVNPSYSMSPPQKLFEYFACGLPVIANKIPTHNDYIIDGVNGIIIDKLLTEDFCRAVLRVLEDNDLLERMRINASENAKQYDLSIIENKLFSKIENLLDEK